VSSTSRCGFRDALVACVLTVLCASSHAQYPTRPIRLVLPLPAGGTADAAARLIGQHLSQTLGQAIVVDNRAGADGIIAAELVMRAPPDGYTLFLGTNGALSAVPAMRRQLPYDPVKSFTPIGYVGNFTFFLFVSTGVPARTVRELVDYGRANPGKLTYGTGNTAALIAGAQFKAAAKLDVAHVPYKGDGPVTTDLLGGRLQYAFMAPVPGYAFVREGRLRAVATLLSARSAMAPDVPTMMEAGLAGVTVMPWMGVFGPAGLPRDLTQRLSRAFGEVLARPDVREALGRQGFEVQSSTPEALALHVKSQLEVWATAVREAGIPIE
jgi:tripartite-type tricarboxylate transporter receptor subunit TctC